ncbi:penicillin-binding protein 1F [Pontibacillus halophilus JSM 076056 = DSM 19796]|uniref:Penicillin-binding protein 1F n=2 Tax=Pontibacillus TaxID=289201 RepID=A0A0A5GH89_9BACI|nr:penicillin-binding protein 1F [Pontibacillus halophilus JSM 076056 = DSM 19796]
MKSKQAKWIYIGIASFLLLLIIGYNLLLLGGKMIVDERKFVLDTASTIETKDGETLTKMYQENRTIVELNEIPEHVQQAFIAVEDGDFYKHSGVDLTSTSRALIKDIIAMEKAEGGSTITQQLVKNLFLTNDKTWTRKFKEVMAALYVDKTLSKDEIMQYYLNTIYFGNGVYGIEAASRYYFNESISEVSISQGALLAAMPKGPNYYDPLDHPERAKDRRNIVLNRMHDEGMLSAEQVVKYSRSDLNTEHVSQSERPWLDSYVDLVVKEASDTYQLSEEELLQGGYRIVVGVDEAAQRLSYDMMKNGDYFPGTSERVQGSFLLMDDQSGEIVAAHGGRNYERGDLNRVNVKRQPGSTMKPLAVYGPALEQEEYEPYSLLTDEKATYNSYTPTNYDGRYAGQISLYKSLQLSKNASTIWLLNEMGLSYSKDYLSKLGIDVGDQGLAIGLGGLENGVTPVDLVRSYRTFNHGGKMIEPHTIVEIYDQNGELVEVFDEEQQEVFTSQTAWNMTRMLENVVAEGTASAGTYEKALAGKTGSTQHPNVEGATKDAWFVGYTPSYVGSVWMGYDRTTNEDYLTRGSSYPTTFMKDFLTEYDKQTDLTTAFTKPDGVQDLEPPINLPVLDDVRSEVRFGAFSFLSARLTWSPSSDERVEYRIYKEQDGKDDELVDAVTGQGVYTLDRVPVFSEARYYVVPYDRLTELEGQPSNIVDVRFSLRN